MCRILCIFMVFFGGFFAQGQVMLEMKEALSKGEQSEQVAKDLIAKSKEGFARTKDATYQGYEAVGWFFMANHAFNPMKKMKYFNRGKELLSTAIKKSPENIELRALRLQAQRKTPGILGYRDEMGEDRAFLKTAIKDVPSGEFKNWINLIINQ